MIEESGGILEKINLFFLRKLQIFLIKVIRLCEE